MVAFFKRDIAAWMDGTESLTLHEYRVYDVVLNLIYFHEGPIVLNERGLAGRCNMTIRWFKRALDGLFAKGKLTIHDGRLSNTRAMTELLAVDDNRIRASRGGVNSGLSRSKSLKTKNAGEAALRRGVKHPTNRLDKTRLDETREEKDIDDWPSDFREQFWSAYPRKISKETAYKALERVRRDGRAAWPDLLAGVMRYAAAMSDTETQFIKHPTTWLNGGCWDDDPAALQRSSGNGHVFGSKEHQRQETANAYRQLCEFAEFGSNDRTGSSGPSEAPARLLPFAKRP